jgi:thiol-disulfide isomerase/thioredoxin
MSVRTVLAVAALLAVPSVVLAQGDKQRPVESAAPAVSLKAGMAAPALAVEKWVKGAPVASFEKGKTYVVEFWATWCTPCIAQMPHLSELSRQYRSQGVTFIGMTSADKRNSLEAVEKMVADKGDGMDYTVAWDQAHTTNEAFMKASGQGGIPCSFLVDRDGKIAYIGHPLFLDEPLAEVLAGTWDVTVDLPALESAIEQYWGFGRKLAQDTKGALVEIEAWEAKHPKLSSLVDDMKFQGLMRAGELETAYAIAGKLVDHAIATKNPSKLNQIAWTIVDPETKLEKRDLELALRAANAAVELSKSKDGAILDTLARTYAWKGDYKKALELQTLALEVTPEEAKEQLRPALEEYKAKAAL